MKINMAFIAILSGILFTLPGCSDKQAQNPAKASPESQTAKQSSPEVLADLEKYSTAVNQAMKPWGDVEKLTAGLAKAKNAKAYVAKLRNEFAPLVSGVMSQMEAIKPATKEIQSIHSVFVASIKDYLDGLQSMAVGVEKSDEAAVNAAAAKLNAFGPARAKFIADTNALANKDVAPAK